MKLRTVPLFAGARLLAAQVRLSFGVVVLLTACVAQMAQWGWFNRLTDWRGWAGWTGAWAGAYLLEAVVSATAARVRRSRRKATTP